MEENNINLKERLDKLWKNKIFLRVIDVCRILSLIFIVLLIIYIIKEVEAVKLLVYDPCKICMQKTGCNCVCFP